ncbi:dihydrofolate reductase family protein [Agrococcus sp. ARC_14]|uniref:dihydrofolate reductase family protein n=1 Tax=Agrococcus sp. ARC_14 TaxID=2919927 RepID=UPI001F070E45|nr:dihydrofolate reductase family protein [Agrococcus sp. ARC_14]MCH1883278.1 dihydrofolate reductase family protein [Agrococcus sp. ARC_14]
MGELHVNMIITLDGVIQANGGANEHDGDYPYAGWEVPYWDDEAGAQMDADVQENDAMLLGHTTYEIFRGFWPGNTTVIGRNFDRVPKYVASRGTPALTWEHSEQVRDAAAEVPALRERHRLIHTWGSGALLQTLFAERLVDRLNLWVCPIVLGTGKRIWPEGTPPARFELIEPPTPYPAGVTRMLYRRLEGEPQTASFS